MEGLDSLMANQVDVKQSFPGGGLFGKIQGNFELETLLKQQMAHPQSEKFCDTESSLL